MVNTMNAWGHKLAASSLSTSPLLFTTSTSMMCSGSNDGSTSAQTHSTSAHHTSAHRSERATRMAVCVRARVCVHSLSLKSVLTVVSAWSLALLGVPRALFFFLDAEWVDDEDDDDDEGVAVLVRAALLVASLRADVDGDGDDDLDDDEDDDDAEDDDAEVDDAFLLASVFLLLLFLSLTMPALMPPSFNCSFNSYCTRRFSVLCSPCTSTCFSMMSRSASRLASVRVGALPLSSIASSSTLFVPFLPLVSVALVMSDADDDAFLRLLPCAWSRSSRVMSTTSSNSSSTCSAMPDDDDDDCFDDGSPKIAGPARCRSDACTAANSS